MADLIAEGNSLTELEQALAELPEGQSVELQLFLPEGLTAEEISQVENEFMEAGFHALVSQDGRIVRIKITNPVAEHVGIPLLIPLLGAGTILGGFAAWRLTSTSVVETVMKAVVPVAMVGIGAVLVYFLLKNRSARSGA